MSKPIVILADLDESYLVTLELKFLKELNNRIELEVITEKEYFEAYFQNPRRADLLVVGDTLYSPELLRHNIGNVYVLAESMEIGGTEDLSIHKIYKYTSIKEIFNELMSEGLTGVIEGSAGKKETQVVAVYSPIGGAGVTTIAVALSAALAKNHKKVLFLSTEILQNFQFYLNNKGFLPNEACEVLKSGREHLYAELKDYIRNEIFYYLPPFYASLAAMGIQFDIYRKFVGDIKESRDYDYIVIDMETGFQEEKASIFSFADRIITVMQQDAFSVQKLENLTRSLELKNNEKFLFICNRFSKEKKNSFVGSRLQEGIGISEYIGVLPLEEADSIIKLERFEELQQLSYLFL